VHWLADQIEAHLARRRAPKIVISDERSKLLDQGGGIKRALPLIGDGPFLICNTDAFWIEGPRSNIARLARSFDPETMDILLLVAAGAGAVGVDWPGDFVMTHDGRLQSREPRHVAPFVYTGVGMVKPQLFASETAEVFRLAPFFHGAAAKGRLYGVRLDGLWVHVGRPENIAEADRAIDRSTL
jgi:N-acetyl-alpha-D-muramate 1-phosphate uridylyltransferase